MSSTARVTLRRLVGALSVPVAALAVTGCGAATPTLAQVRSEPVLDVPAGATLLLREDIKPRPKAIGRDGRDGGSEIVFASPQPASSVADQLQAQWGFVYGLKRVDNTAGATLVGSELRGVDSETGAAVQIVVTTGEPYTLLAGPDELARPPEGSRSYTSVSVLSEQS